jgi:surface polysaccharide O-acyltransferase-like enzyme
MKKTAYFNNLRIVATIAVVLLHVNSPSMYQWGAIPYANWLFSDILNSLVRFCVPIFVMISGALNLTKGQDLVSFFKRRFTKVIIPFAFWCVVYVAYVYFTAGGGNYLYRLYEGVKNVPFYHLWFLYTLIGLYLFTPILSVFINNCERKHIEYFLFIWGVTLFYTPFKKYLPDFKLMYFTDFIGYYVLGYYLASFKTRIENVKASLLLILIGTLITAVGTAYYTTRQNQLFEDFCLYLTPNVVIQSIGVFLLFKTAFNNDNKNKLLGYILSFSFFIYFIHPIFIEQLGNIGFIKDLKATLSVFYIPLFALVVLTLSVLSALALNKIPLIKKLAF